MRSVLTFVAAIAMAAVEMAAVGLAEEKAQYCLTAMAANTNTAIASIKVGQEFDLGLFVRDLRPRNSGRIRGVFAAYCDVGFEKSLAVAGTPKFSTTYPNGVKGVVTPGKIDDVGAFADSFSGLGTTPHEVWRVRVKALRAGTVNFTITFDVKHPACDTLVYGNIGVDPPEESHVDPATEIRITNTKLTINTFFK